MSNNLRIEIPIVDSTQKRQQLINKIEEQVLIIIKQICNSEAPKINYQRCNINPNDDDDNDDNDVFSQYSGIVDSEENNVQQSSQTTVDFSKERGRNQLNRLMIILSKVHSLLTNNKIQTNRSLYYELKSEEPMLFESERIVNYQINIVAKLLECMTWNLGLVPTAKGLVVGNLILIFENNDKINCNVMGGCSIPHIMSNNMGQLVSIETGAKLLIVVEKEAIFNKLLSENCPVELNAILITGKGYPDTATRIFVKMLVDKLKLPVFVLVDCNPQGFEIMSTYKYGSLNLWWEREELQCPQIKWIGVYPSEMSIYFIKKVPLTDTDLKKLEALEKRKYFSEDEKRELKLMRQGKIDVEAISGNDFISINYLTSAYIPLKIQRFTQSDD